MKKSLKNYLLLIIPALLVSGIRIASITSSFPVEQNVNTISDSLDGPRVATAEQTLHYYVDPVQDFAPVVYYNSILQYQKLQVRLSLGGVCIVTGVRYRHYDIDSGPFDIDLTFGSDSGSAPYSDLNVPAAFSGAWRNFSCLGPTYVIDDDPYVSFSSTDTYDNCIEFCRDDDAPGGHSYFDNSAGTWTQETASEYVVEIEYETIQTLTKDASQSGNIAGSDYVDAYYVTLTGGLSYEFTLTRSSGTGNLNMRLVNYVNHGTTGSSVNSTSGSSYPEKMRFTPSSTTTYLLLIEPTTSLDMAVYSIVFSQLTAPPADDAYEENDAFGSAYMLSTGSYPSLLCADNDWFRIYVTAGNTVTAYISFTNSLGNLDLQLYNSAQVQLNSSTSTNNWERVSYAVSSSGYYYVYVYRYSGTGSNNYAMTLSIADTGGDDIYEENDVLLDAASITTGIYSSLVCADDDWFKIWVSVGNTLVVTVTPVPSGDNLDLEITFSTGNTAKNGAISAGSNIASLDVTTSGTYYIKVSMAGAANTYEMIILTTPNIKPGGIAGFDVFLLLGASSLTIYLMLWKKLKYPK